MRSVGARRGAGGDDATVRVCSDHGHHQRRLHHRRTASIVARRGGMVNRDAIANDVSTMNVDTEMRMREIGAPMHRIVQEESGGAAVEVGPQA